MGGRNVAPGGGRVKGRGGLSGTSRGRMRIHLFGAVLAFDYMLAGWLRQRGVDAHYFFNIKRNEADYPWWEDASFDRERMPEWCHYHPFRLPYFYRAPLGKEGERFLHDFRRDADLLLGIGDGALIANHYRVPYSVFSCGFEVEVAVPAPIEWKALAGRVFGRREPVNLQRALNRTTVQRNLRHAESLISAMEFQLPSYLTQAGITENVTPLPMLYDCGRYAPAPSPAINARYADLDVVFFLPTRHSYRTFTSNDKGVDKVIRAYAEFRRTSSVRSRLVMIRKGERVADSEAAVAALGLGDHVDWLPMLRKEELKHYYSVPNVVVLDQFANEDSVEPVLYAALRRFGARGTIFAEAMCTGCAVVSNVGTEWITRFSPRPFLFDACTEPEILAALHAVAGVPAAERRVRGEENRAWAYRHLHWEGVIDAYVGHFEGVVRRIRDRR
jgi:glycosyltransferase involved in cell wall biosynthesis